MKESQKIYLEVKDYLVSAESFQLIYDSDLDMLKTYPQPNSEDLPKYYESENYISHTDEKKGLFSWLYQVVKKWSHRKKVNLINKLNNGKGSLLDIGAGTGEFLKEAKDNGWNAFGTEPNKNASKLASEKGIYLNSNLDNFVGKEFDVVTLWHVLEHIVELEETVLKLSSLVKDNGTLIVAVPNFKSYDANYYKEFWAAYDTPRHLWHFSKKAIQEIFSQHFSLQEIRPMVFDSFYVSLLSEKYKTGNKFSLKAFWIGFLSNIKAKSSKEYSSHIYCLKKRT